MVGVTGGMHKLERYVLHILRGINMHFIKQHILRGLLLVITVISMYVAAIGEYRYCFA